LTVNVICTIRMPNKRDDKLKKFAKHSKEIFEGVGLVVHLGLTMVVSIIGFFLLGLYLDKKFHLGGIAIIISLIFGIIIGAYSGYKLIQKDEDNE